MIKRRRTRKKDGGEAKEKGKRRDFPGNALETWPQPGKGETRYTMRQRRRDARERDRGRERMQRKSKAKGRREVGDKWLK